MAPGVEEIMIFAHQIHPSGCRTFITATPTSFFEKYRCMPYYDRSFYEVLNAGKPCNLFMDIEFFCELNQGLNGEICMKIVRLIIKNEIYILTIQRFPHLLPSVCSFDDLPDKGITMETDSSARYKFSRHIVCRLPLGLVFSNTGHCGAFVQRISFSFRKCLLNFSD